MARMIDHVGRHLLAAAGRGAGEAMLLLVSPGEKIAAGDSWMLAWARVDILLAGLARLLEEDWLLRRTGAGYQIARVVGKDAAPADRWGDLGAAAVLAKSGSVAFEASDGRLVNARFVGLAPASDAHRAAGVLAETLALPGLRFVSRDRMHKEALHLTINSDAGVWEGRVGPCAMA